MLNKVILMGRLTKDPDIRYSQGEKATCVARFSLAVNRRFKRDGEPDADFINCVAFGKNGEFVEKYLRQGIKIVLVGHIQTGSYTDKNGAKRYTTDIIAEEMSFAESRAASTQATGQQPTRQQGNAPAPANQGGYNAPPAGAPNPANAATPPANADNAAAPYGGFMTIPEGLEEELPFI